MKHREAEEVERHAVGEHQLDPLEAEEYGGDPLARAGVRLRVRVVVDKDRFYCARDAESHGRENLVEGKAVGELFVQLEDHHQYDGDRADEHRRPAGGAHDHESSFQFALIETGVTAG